MSTSGRSDELNDFFERYRSMRWVATESEGGPYDDLGFAAGVIVGSVSSILSEQKQVPGTFEVLSDLIPQLQLVAMTWNYDLAVLGTDTTQPYAVSQVKFTQLRGEWVS